MMENKLMIKLVVLTEGMFFLSLIMAFVYMAYNAGFEKHDVRALNITSTAIFTLLLAVSSLTLWLAERQFKSGNIKGLKFWLLITILLGGTFLFGQGREYLQLVHQHVTLSGSLFGTSFYTLTGFHGLHVFIGLVILSILLWLTLLGDFNNSSSTVIGTAAIYWHFVDIVWLFVFTIVYVIPLFIKF
ncbi:MAG: cytochrome c oxidase subunit 3 [Bacteroidota bacterium]